MSQSCSPDFFPGNNVLKFEVVQKGCPIFCSHLHLFCPPNSHLLLRYSVSSSVLISPHDLLIEGLKGNSANSQLPCLPGRRQLSPNCELWVENSCDHTTMCVMWWLGKLWGWMSLSGLLAVGKHGRGWWTGVGFLVNVDYTEIKWRSVFLSLIVDSRAHIHKAPKVKFP